MTNVQFGHCEIKYGYYVKILVLISDIPGILIFRYHGIIRGLDREEGNCPGSMAEGAAVVSEFSRYYKIAIL